LGTQDTAHRKKHNTKTMSNTDSTPKPGMILSAREG